MNRKNNINAVIRVNDKSFKGTITKLRINGCVFVSNDDLNEYVKVDDEVLFQLQINANNLNEDAIDIISVIDSVKGNEVRLKFKNLKKSDSKKLNRFVKSGDYENFNMFCRTIISLYVVYRWIQKRVLVKVVLGTTFLMLLLVLLFVKANNLMYPNYAILVGLSIVAGKALGLFRGLIYYNITDIKSSFIGHEADIILAAEKDIKIVSGWISHMCYDHPVFKKNLWEVLQKRNVSVKIIFYDKCGIDPRSKTFIKWLLNKKHNNLNISLHASSIKAKNHFIIVDDTHLLVESTHLFGRPPRQKMVFLYSPIVSTYNQKFRNMLIHSKRANDLVYVFEESIKGLICELGEEVDKDMIIKYFRDIIPGQIATWFCLLKSEGEGNVLCDGVECDNRGDDYKEKKYNDFLVRLEKVVEGNPDICVNNIYCKNNCLDKSRFEKRCEELYKIIEGDY